jgi:hypothetical protein
VPRQQGLILARPSLELVRIKECGRHKARIWIFNLGQGVRRESPTECVATQQLNKPAQPLWLSARNQAH